MKQKHVSMETQTFLDCRHAVHTICLRSDLAHGSSSKMSPSAHIILWFWYLPLLPVFTPIHLHIHMCHLVIFTSFHLDIFTSSHLPTSFLLLHIFSSHTCTPSHLKISSWDLHIVSSSLLHISLAHLLDSKPHSFKSDLIMFTSFHPRLHHMSFKHLIAIHVISSHLFDSFCTYELNMSPFALGPSAV